MATKNQPSANDSIRITLPGKLRSAATILEGVTKQVRHACLIKPATCEKIIPIARDEVERVKMMLEIIEMEMNILNIS